MSKASTFQTAAARSPRIALMLAGGLVFGACAPDRIISTNSIPDDYRARHPIAIQQAPISTDIFLAGGKFDEAARLRVRGFAQDYVRAGTGPVVIQTPRGHLSGAEAQAAVNGVRQELARAGARGFVSVSHYDPADPTLASPIRLSFVGMRASVTTRCGEWPRDLGGGGMGFNNTSYWNFGCAHQQALAAQVADPRDLATPRGETPVDTAMRSRAISKVRAGEDPTTQWAVEATPIAGGGN
jgi:pilus assembly protein CpaD